MAVLLQLAGGCCAPTTHACNFTGPTALHVILQRLRTRRLIGSMLNPNALLPLPNPGHLVCRWLTHSAWWWWGTRCAAGTRNRSGPTWTAKITGPRSRSEHPAICAACVLAVARVTLPAGTSLMCSPALSPLYCRFVHSIITTSLPGIGTRSVVPPGFSVQ